MKRLTLIRHAKSSWSDLSTPDFERPLNQRGFKDAPRIGAYLAKTSFPAPDRILASPALRTITTARLISETLGENLKNIHLEPRIYEASLLVLYSILTEQEDQIGHIVLIGHNPGMEQLARSLYQPFKGDGEKFPTCGVAQMELQIDRWCELAESCAQKADFICPKML